MNCFIIACLTADGYIGKNSSHAATWTSKEDKRRFVELTKRARVVVMGQNTWLTLGGKPLKDRLNIVYSPEPLPDVSGMETTTLEPRKLIENLASRGYSEVAICGGSQIYTMFMLTGVVDKLYLTIEPVLFGDGVRLFKQDIESKLCLDEQTRTDSGTQFLTYSVIK